MEDASAARAEEAIPEELTITFRKEIVHASQTFTHIKLHEPTAGQWEEWDKLEGVAASRKAIATVAAVPEAVIKQMLVRDFRRATDYLNRFF